MKTVTLSVLILLSASAAAQAQYVEDADQWRSSGGLVKVERFPVQTNTVSRRITPSTLVYYPEPVAYGDGSGDEQEIGREVYLTEQDYGEDEERGRGYGDYGGQGIQTYHGVAEDLPPPPVDHHHGHHGHDHDLGCCSCRDIYLGCVFPCGNKGSFVLRCDDTGVATYYLEGKCVRAALLEKIGQDKCFVYYREVHSSIRWAFSLEPISHWHRVWISHKRNPLDAEWRRFCTGERADDCYDDHHHCHDGHCYP